MSYRRKTKNYGFGSMYGGSRYRSGYLRGKDPTEAYRQPSKQPDEYERKLRRELERIDTEALSGNFTADTSNYKTNFPKQSTETKLSQKQIDELTANLLDNAMEEFKKITGQSELSQEKYETMQGVAGEVAQRLEEIRNNPEDRTTVVDFVDEFLGEKESSQDSSSDTWNRVQEIRSEMERMKEEALEIRDSLPEFENLAKEIKEANEMFANSGIPAEASTPDKIIEEKPAIEPEIPEAQDALSQAKKRNSGLGYESEFDAM